MAINTPRNGAVGFGEESTFGTAVARAVWRPAIGLNPSLKTASSDYQDLYRSGAGSAKRNSIDSREFSDSVSLLASYTRFGMVLKHALGSVGSTGPVGSDYTHTYDPAALPTGLTVEGIRGSNATSELAVGCQIPDWTFESSTRSKRAVFTFGLWGKDSTRPSKGTPSYGATDDPILHYHLGSTTWNSIADLKPTSVRVTGNNGLERVYTKAVTVDSFVESGDRVYGAVVSFYDTNIDDFYDAWKAGTESDLVIPYANGSLSLTFTLRNARITNISEPIRSGGALTREITFAPRADGSDEALAVVIVNENASGIAN